MKNGMKLGWLVVLALIASGCATPEEKYFLETETNANVYVAPDGASVKKVAVMPFKAPTELIGASVSDLFVTEMLKAGKYKLVERGQLTTVLKESELSLAGLSAAGAVEIGNMVGADGVIMGTVAEYGTVAYRGDPYASVGVTARLIDCKSATVIWSVDYSGTARSRRTTLSEQARFIVHDMCASLFKKWREME